MARYGRHDRDAAARARGRVPHARAPQSGRRSGFANRLLDAFEAPFTDRAVIIDGSRCSEASPSFAAGIVDRVLIREGAASLTIAGAPPQLVETAHEVARAAGLDDRVFVLTNSPTRDQVPA